MATKMKLEEYVEQQGFTTGLKSPYKSEVTFRKWNIRIEKKQIPSGHNMDKARKTVWSLWNGGQCIEFNTTKQKVFKSLKTLLEED